MTLRKTFSLRALLFKVVPVCACLSLALAYGLRVTGVIRPARPPFGNVFASHAHGIYALPTWEHGYPKYDRLGNVAFYDDQQNNIVIVPKHVKGRQGVILVYSSQATCLRLSNATECLKVASLLDRDSLVIITSPHDCERLPLPLGVAADFNRSTPIDAQKAMPDDLFYIVRGLIAQQDLEHFDRIVEQQQVSRVQRAVE